MGMEARAARAAGGRRSLRDSLLFRVGGGVDRGGADGVGRMREQRLFAPLPDRSASFGGFFTSRLAARFFRALFLLSGSSNSLVLKSLFRVPSSTHVSMAVWRYSFAQHKISYGSTGISEPRESRGFSYLIIHSHATNSYSYSAGCLS